MSLNILRRWNTTKAADLIDEFVEEYIRNLPWSSAATEHDKALVGGNIRLFSRVLRNRLRDQADGECIRALRRSPQISTAA